MHFSLTTMLSSSVSVICVILLGVSARSSPQFSPYPCQNYQPFSYDSCNNYPYPYPYSYPAFQYPYPTPLNNFYYPFQQMPVGGDFQGFPMGYGGNIQTQAIPIPPVQKTVSTSVTQKPITMEISRQFLQDKDGRVKVNTAVSSNKVNDKKKE